MHDVMTPQERVPVTLLTGLAGQQEALSIEQLIHAPHRCRIAVIEHAPGEQFAPVEYLQDTAHHGQTDTGCVCCTVRGDPLLLLEQLAQRRDRGELSFDRVVIDTTGLADPSIILRAVRRRKHLAAYYSISTIRAPAGSGRKPAAQKGGLIAHRVANGDGVTPMEAEQVSGSEARALLAKLRNGAPLGAVQPDGSKKAGRSRKKRDVMARLGLAQYSAANPSHRIGSFVFRSQEPFRIDRLGKFMASVLQVYGNDLLRYKGVLYFTDASHRVMFWGTHIMMGSEAGPEWTAMETKESVMVFVGRNLPEELLREGLEQCLASAEAAWKL
jgi:G3E family GTPase